MLRAALVFSFALPMLTAQEPAVDPGHSRHGGEFDEGPRQAAYLMSGMNSQVHLPVAGLDDETQRFFDQGITQLHGFWYFEAERSFREVEKRHPDCAMAHWGMTLANCENEPRAASCIANAVRCSAAAPHREQLWVDAWAAFHGIDEHARAELRSGDNARVKTCKDALAAANKDRNREAKNKAYQQLLKDLGTLVHEDPKDIEAKALLAVYIWHAYDWGSGIPITSHVAVDALLDQVFAAAPQHPAHHYRVHLWDAEKAERALASAAALGDSAPGIAHQWHMAGHIYAKLDRHAEAAWQQEASARVDHAYMMRDAVMPFLIHNYGHNQEWLARSLSYGGRGAEALDIAKNLAELPRHPKYNAVDKGDSIAGYARTRLVQVCEDLELWPQAVAVCTDGHLERSDSVKGEVQRLGLLGRALFRLGRADEGARVIADVDALLAKARADRAAALDKAEDDAVAKKEPANKSLEAVAEAGREPTNSVRSVLDLQRELRGEQLLAKGDAKAAVAEFQAVPHFPKTLLADAYVAAGEPEKAIALLEKDVKDHPHRAPTAVRLCLAYAAAGMEKHPERWVLFTELPMTSDRDEPATPLAARMGAVIASMGDLIESNCRPRAERTEAFPFGDDFGKRPPLASLGPKSWSPVANAGFALPLVGAAPEGDGVMVQLNTGGALLRGIGGHPSAAQGRAHLIVFYLGFGCLHCVKQLEALAPKAKDFAAAGIDIVAIGNESLAVARRELAALGDGKPSFPLLADPELAAFRAWHCFDDFEQVPLHGTFLVDAEGKVRWQDIAAEPFTQLDWLYAESVRLLALRLPAR
jgi:peroxiredoxin/tetratricopeptide (TPR) repeat protein